MRLLQKLSSLRASLAEIGDDKSQKRFYNPTKGAAMLLKFPCIPATLRVELRKRRESSRDWLSTEHYWGGEHDYGGVNLGILHGADSLHGTRLPVPRRITPLEHFAGALSSVEQRIMCGLDCMLVRWHVLQPLASGLFRSNPVVTYRIEV